MPLLDHFRPPLGDEHIGRSFLIAWANTICDRWNEILPEGYYFGHFSHVGRLGTIDHSAYGSPSPDRLSSQDAPPKATIPAVLADDLEVRVWTASEGVQNRAVVAFVLPANKAGADARRAFAVKCANHLYHGVAVVIVDVVTERGGNLHRETLDLLGHPDTARLPDRSPLLYTTAYRPIRRGEGTEVDVWAEPVAVGSPLPTLPLWLNAVEAVPVELEATYTDACRRRRIGG